MYNAKRPRRKFGKVLHCKKAKRDKKQSKIPKKTTTMIIFYSERAKRARKSFGKVLQSKRLRGIKNRASKKQ